MGIGTVIVTSLLLLACVVVLCLTIRRARLVRGGGVDLCLRRRSAFSGRSLGRATASGWRYGIARYRGDQLAWFPLLSLRFGPSVVVDRTDLEIVERRAPSAAEAPVMPPEAAVLRTRARGEQLELAMSNEVLMGFLAWLEAIPPGRTGNLRVS